MGLDSYPGADAFTAPPTSLNSMPLTTAPPAPSVVFTLALALVSNEVLAFAPNDITPCRSAVSSQPRDVSPLAATLTDRQLQFWEDVEDGLDDVSAVFEGKGFDIERIRAFGISARGETPPPVGDAIGHQPSEEHVEGLTPRPFWDVADDAVNFPWAADLEAKSHVIRNEFEAKLGEDGSFFAGDSAWQNAVMGTGWSAFRLQRLGVWNVKNCKQFPKTYEILRSLEIPLAVRGVCFARQAAGSGVAPHSDGRNFILTSHLGLRVPEGCWIKVGEEERTWEEGKLTTVDTSFEHSTGNPAEGERHVLIIDFWHPELTEAERAALEFVYDLRNKFENGEIEVRAPRSKRKEQGGGLNGLWSSLTGGGN